MRVERGACALRSLVAAAIRRTPSMLANCGRVSARGEARPQPGQAAGRSVLGKRTHGIESAAIRAVIRIGRHGYLSAASGTSTPPVMNFVGPSMPGLMSKSKISVGR